jgi:hypothetical protein
MNVNVANIHNVYNQTVVNNVTVVNHVSYNGGEGGIQERPTARELAVEQERHIPPVPAQIQHVQTARSNPQLRASANQGKPPVAATVRPGQLSGHGAVPARAATAPYHPPGRPATSKTRAPTGARELQPHQVPPAQGNAAVDLSYQREQQKLIEEQNNEHLKLQRQQEIEDQQAAAQKWNQQRRQQMEQLHQQQTRQMEQRHAQQLQQLITRQNARRPH